MTGDIGIKKFFCACISIFFIFSVSAQVQPEDAENASAGNPRSEEIPPEEKNAEKKRPLLTLKEIDALIAQTDYSTALVALSDYMKAYPAQLDFAQRRIDKIMKARSQYVVLANTLIDVMENEPENAEKKLEIIAELESVEKNPTEEQLSFIQHAKTAAQFTYYRARFRKIIGEATELADRGAYSQAVASIQTGFDMYREEFYKENPPETTQAVTPVVEDISALCKEYEGIQDKLKNAYTVFLSAVKSGNIRDSENAYQNFQSEILNFSRIRNRLFENARSLQNTFASLQKQNSELTEASYLPFVFRFTLGLESSSKSGILGAMDTQFREYIETLKPAVYDTIAKINFAEVNADNIGSMGQNDIPSQKLDSAARFANLGVSVNSLYDTAEGFRYGTDFKEYVQRMEYVGQIVSKLGESYAVLNEYQNVNTELSRIEKPADAVLSIRSENSYSARLIDCSTRYDECAKKSDALLHEDWFSPYFQKSEDERRDAEYRFLNGYYLSLNETLRDVCKQAGLRQWQETAAYFASATNDIYGYYQNQYDSASKLLGDRYPSEALSLLEKTDAELNSDIQILSSCQNTILESSAVKDTDVPEAQEALKNIEKINGFRAQSRETAAACTEAVLNNRRALNEAEFRYSQAQQAFRNSDYTAARRNIELSSAKYKEAFDYQESPSLREESDRKLMSLGQQINDAENKLVVAEVRALKNQAKTEYYNGNFERAETLLVQAKSRWAVTNGDEEDAEIKNLLALVETALSMKTGRTIPQTAPLYPEMSQILSIAHQYFDKGSELFKKGNREEGTLLLEQSKQKLQEVRLVYPLNQEASLLTLRIDQLINPDSFNEMFEQKINSAKENYKVPSTLQTAYTDLLDLYEIRPDYPGLASLIYQIEIDIGIRQKPVDNSMLVRSQQLTQQADSIIASAGNNENQLRSALEKLDQAIQLNPNNDRAVLLKDRVQVALGGRSSVVLSSADEAKYQQAIQELQKNNIIGAYSLVEQLMQNSANRRSSKVLDLQKKVKALL